MNTNLSKDEAAIMLPVAHISRHASAGRAGRNEIKLGMSPQHPCPVERRVFLWSSIIEKLNQIINSPYDEQPTK